MALNLNYDIENPANWELFLTNLADGVSQLHERHPLELHLLPMQQGFKAHDDVQVLDLSPSGCRRSRSTATSCGPTSTWPPSSTGATCWSASGCTRSSSPRSWASHRSRWPTTSRSVSWPQGSSLDKYVIDINRPFEVSDLVERLGALLGDLSAVGAAVEARSDQLRARALADFARVQAWLVQ